MVGGGDERNSGTVRARILAEHASLREHLSALVARPSAKDTARFLEELEAHLAHEDELLEPLLAAAGGPEPARRMREEHTAQRRELKWMRTHLHDPRGAELGPWLKHFADRLVRDMENEERERLAPGLLEPRTGENVS